MSGRLAQAVPAPPPRAPLPPPPIILSSDEAADTGDESDEDLITSYLGGSHAGHHGSASPATHLPAYPDVLPPHAPAGDPPHHILADNLQQLAEIHENIQRMRLANTEGVPSRPPARSHRSSHADPLHQRWSTSCPALNHDESLELAGAGPSGGGSAESGPSPESQSATYHYSTTTPTSSTSHTGRSHRKRLPGGWSSSSTAEGLKHRGKTRAGRPRSYSASSNDSDEPFGPPGGDFVDGCFSGTGSQPRLRSASTVATTRGSVGSKSNYGGPSSGPSSHRTPEKLLPRPPVGSRYTPNIFSQFPGLHKSISTPSIATDHPHNRSAHRKGRDYPEPTHVFLQKLISEHEWTRRSGSDSDSDDEPPGPPPAGLLPEIDGRRPHHRVPFPLEQPSGLAAHPSVQPAPSPQISLAEFLQDVPNLEDDDQRKRRRKKERSSIFFRKKKDKSKSASASLQTQPDGHMKSLAKAPSAISLSTKPLQTRVPQHSYSMSSLRKPSSHNHYGGNFYHARGETR